MEEPSWYQRRVLRSLKKVFQSRSCVSVVLGLALACVDGGEVVAVDACLVLLGEDFLKETCRFRSGTRRVVLVGEEESDDRRGVAGAVWNEVGVRRVGCIRQPIAAVRRVGAVHSILSCRGRALGVLEGRCEVEWCWCRYS